MIEITFSSSFKRAFKKRIKGQQSEPKFWDKFLAFKQDPFDNRLRLHKLSGNLQDLWSFSIDYDYRVILYFDDEMKTKAVFVDIGKHDVVY